MVVQVNKKGNVDPARGEPSIISLEAPPLGLTLQQGKQVAWADDT